MSGITLEQVSKQQRILSIQCTRCRRRGRYQVKNLIAQHGGTLSLPELTTTLTADCRNVDGFAVDRCDVTYPDLKTRS